MSTRIDARTDRRNAELAKIHIAQKQLALDDATYRAMLWSIAGIRSAKELDGNGRKKVLEHLKACGFKGRQRTVGTYPGRPHNIETNPQLQKVEALLADAGRPWKYADSMTQRMFNVDRVAFCNPDQLQRLIAALTYDQQRRAHKPNP
jgi:Mu-like prophage protein gp16